ncbi:hypothetical protein COOONC_13711 [Cooperia oncophora]
MRAIGKAPYVYVQSHVYFSAKDDQGTFSVQVLADFDNEDIAQAATTDIQFSIKDKSILLLTSRYFYAIPKQVHLLSE